MLHRSAVVQQPSMTREIINGIVKRKPVIPHHQLTLGPGDAGGKFTAGHMLIQKLQQRLTFLFGHPDKARGEHAIEIDTFRPCLRMTPYDRMHCRL